MGGEGRGGEGEGRGREWGGGEGRGGEGRGGGTPRARGPLVTRRARLGGPPADAQTQGSQTPWGRVLSDACRTEGGRKPGGLKVVGVGGDEKHGVGSGAWARGAHSE